jgi:hypothetical protein
MLRSVNAPLPLALLLLVLGLPNLYVGWSLSRGRGVPRLVAQDRVLTVVFTDEWLPPELRGSAWFEGGIRVVVGASLLFAGAVFAVLAVAGPVP